MQKKFLSLIVVSIALLLFLGAGLQDPGLVGAAGGDGAGEEYGNIEWDNPGSLKLTKDAEAETHNRWKISLGIEGIDEQKESDVVLVIDTSGSMKGSQMTSAKAAAKNFVNTLLDEGDTHTRIALVSFANYADVHGDGEGGPFKGVAGKDALLTAIDGLNATGGTFTQDGLKKARDIIAQHGRDEVAKYVVLLSDGEPTYSYEIKTVKDKLNETYFYQDGKGSHLVFFTDWYWYSRDDLTEDVFDYGSRSDGGSAMTTFIHRVEVGPWYNPSYNSYYYHHGNSAVAESRFIKELSDTTIYSIGFELGATGQDIMDRVATEGKSFSATEANLQTVFHEIAGSISHAATGAVVTDPLGDMFSLVVGSIEVSEGTSFTYNQDTKTITWTIGEIQQGSPPEMSYIVEIDPSALSGVLYPTNKETYVDYTNIDGDDAKKQFPIPKVGIDAIGVIEITKEFTGTGGDANKQFAIYVEDGNGGRWSMLLAAGQSDRIAGLSPGTYTIREVVPMGYKLVGISPLEVTFTAADLNEVKKVTVTNKKTGEPWFRDDDDKVNEFKLGTW